MCEYKCIHASILEGFDTELCSQSSFGGGTRGRLLLECNEHGRFNSELRVAEC